MNTKREGGIPLRQIFNELIKQDIKPFLIKLGFKKKGLNFYRKPKTLSI